MIVALAGLFNDHIIDKIVSFYNPCPEVEWEQVYGSKQIYRTTHLITYDHKAVVAIHLENTSQAGIGGTRSGTADRHMRWY